MSDLRTVRKEKKLSEEDLAGLLGIHQGTLAEVEGGKRLPQKSTRQKIERILGSKINWLATYSADRNHVAFALRELMNPAEPRQPERPSSQDQRRR